MNINYKNVCPIKTMFKMLLIILIKPYNCSLYFIHLLSILKLFYFVYNFQTLFYLVIIIIINNYGIIYKK